MISNTLNTHTHTSTHTHLTCSHPRRQNSQTPKDLCEKYCHSTFLVHEDKKGAVLEVLLGWTAVHREVYGGRAEAVQKLIDDGADVNVPDKVCECMPSMCVCACV